MDIHTARTLKTELENSILKLCQTYEQLTDLQITSVTIDNDIRVMGQKSGVCKVNVLVMLPVDRF